MHADEPRRSAPATPTGDEIAANEHWAWEYDQTFLDVSTIADPPESRPPIFRIRRRIVGEWEVYDTEETG